MENYTIYRYHSMRACAIVEIKMPEPVRQKLLKKYEAAVESNRTLIPRYNNADEFIEDWLSVHY